jgi:ERCC4-type nuclease
MTNKIDYSAYYICIASGESKLLKNLEELRDKIPQENQFHIENTGLHTGDILIGYKDPNYTNEIVLENFITKKIDNLRPLILIERKTISDYCQSLKSQHYQNQKSRMMSYRDQTGCRCTLVVEGFYEQQDLSPNICGTPLSTLEQAFTSIQYRDNFCVMHVENTYFHAEYIMKILKSYEKYKLYKGNYSDNDDNLRKDFMDSLKARKKTNLDPKMSYNLMISNIPDISVNMAEKISELYPTMKTLITHLETNGPDSLANIQLNKNKFGKVKSQKIYQYILQTSNEPDEPNEPNKPKKTLNLTTKN